MPEAVPPVPPITWPKELKFVGKKDEPRVLARGMVTGTWDYASDIVLPEMLYARVLGSPYAHAKITSIDTSKAEALPGVKAVVTNKDNPIFRKELTWWGCPVAGVAATSLDIVEEALKLIDVKYEVLPFVIDGDEAMKPGAPETGVYPKNLFTFPEIKRGDVTKGFAEAEVIFEDTVGWTANFHHQHSEARACVAKWDGDFLTVWHGSQNPFSNRDFTAANLNIPLNKCRMISHGTGTGFGDKHASEHNVFAALLAKKAGHPVKLVLDGYERTTQCQHQYPCKATIKIGAKKDGTFTAIEMSLWADGMGGGYGYGAFPAWAGDAISPMQITYTCANALFKGYSVATNIPPFGPWRCVGEPSGNFLMDIVIDELAEKLGIDPVELRVKNAFKGKIGELKDQDSGLLLSSMAMEECFTKAADAIGWKTKWHKPGTKTLPDGRLHGIGVSGLVCNKGAFATGSGTMVLMTTDGKTYLCTGISSANGGSTTTLSLIVAEQLGLASMDDIALMNPGDTATNQDSGMEGGSTRTITAGAGAYMAALDAKLQLFEIAAPMLGVKPEELEAKDGKVYVKADPTKAVTLKEVCAKAYAVKGTNLIGRGYQWFAPKHIVRTECVEAAEVAVDPETGDVEVLSMVCVDDLGRAIHWKGSENQCEGGMVQMISQAKWEQQLFDKATGATLNPDLLEHKYCTSLDIPDLNMKTILVESMDVVGPYGCKGLGEPPVAPGHGAIINAIYNATGKWVKKHPAWPQDVLKALGKA